MKLRDKETGKIVKFDHIGLNNDVDRSDGIDDDVFFVSKEDRFYSLAELYERFEDVPKPWKETVKVRELPSGLRIADLNYYEIDEGGKNKTNFTWDEAMKRFKDDPNWRLPTPKELCQIVVDLGYNDKGIFEGELLAKNLGEDALKDYENNDDSGYYWSSIAYSSTRTLALNFGSTCLCPFYEYGMGLRLAIRCVVREGE